MKRKNTGFAIAASEQCLIEVASALYLEDDSKSKELAERILDGQYVMIMIVSKRTSKKLLKRAASIQIEDKDANSIVRAVNSGDIIEGTVLVVMSFGTDVDIIPLANPNALRIMAIEGNVVLSRLVRPRIKKEGDKNEGMD